MIKALRRFIFLCKQPKDEREIWKSWRKEEKQLQKEANEMTEDDFWDIVKKAQGDSE